MPYSVISTTPFFLPGVASGDSDMHTGFSQLSVERLLIPDSQRLPVASPALLWQIEFSQPGGDKGCIPPAPCNVTLLLPVQRSRWAL
jgi:hypothetical protein